MRMIVIGNIGSDAGYWVIDENGLHHVGGWGIEQLVEFRASMAVISAATRLKTPGLAEGAIKSVQRFAEGQIAQHLGQAERGGGQAGAQAAGGAQTIVVVMA